MIADDLLRYWSNIISSFRQQSFNNTYKLLSNSERTEDDNVKRMISHPYLKKIMVQIQWYSCKFPRIYEKYIIDCYRLSLFISYKLHFSLNCSSKENNVLPVISRNSSLPLLVRLIEWLFQCKSIQCSIFVKQLISKTFFKIYNVVWNNRKGRIREAYFKNKSKL